MCVCAYSDGGRGRMLISYTKYETAVRRGKMVICENFKKKIWKISTRQRKRRKKPFAKRNRKYSGPTVRRRETTTCSP